MLLPDAKIAITSACADHENARRWSTCPTPEEIEALKKALSDALGEVRVLRNERDLLKEQLNRFKRQLFDAKSEVSAAHQKDMFFNEAEVEGAQAQPAAAETEDEKVEVPAHQRAKRGRKPLDPRCRGTCGATNYPKTNACAHTTARA